MGTSSCLFSRARPGKSTPKKVRGFLSLPGELRNHIYQYYFESELRCEVAAKGLQLTERKARTVKLCSGILQPKLQVYKYSPEAKDESPITIRISRPLGKYTTVQGLKTNWFASLYAINLVCKQLHAETLAFLYHKTIFVFDAPNRITNFLSVVSTSNLAHITKLQLHYTTYGCPHLMKYRIWQEKHSKSWIRACTAASKNLVGLRSLKIWMRVHDDPLRFNLRQSWVLPMLQFRRLSRTPKAVDGRLDSETREQVLEVVDIDFRTRLSGFHFGGNRDLAKASEELHRLFGQALSKAILGAKEEEAMMAFDVAWNGKHEAWQYHLGFAKTGW